MNGQITTRTDALYGYMTSRNQWTKLKDVYSALRGCYAPQGKGEFHNSTARRQITADIKAINDSPRYEKIIIHGDEGIKIASDEEAALYVRSRDNEAKRALAHVSVLRDKIGGANVALEEAR